MVSSLSPNWPEIEPAERRKLRVFGFDPMTSRVNGSVLTLDVPWEPLDPGPVGQLVQVCDILPDNNWVSPVDLDDLAIVHRDGLTPSESDPRSHQQGVYAIASAVIERFEKFLGRRFRWRSTEKLTLFPHAFEGTNAFFDPEHRAVMFGFYRAAASEPGAALPNQLLYTCLSFDIVAHEVTHALIHRLRKNFVESTNPDVLACHEAFADLVTLFHHFVFPDVVAGALAQSRGDLAEAQGLFDLATEFGRTTGRNGPLRRALEPAATPPPDLENPDVPTTVPLRLYAEAVTPHERGSVFVAAVFDAFVATYRHRIADLLRIATGGTGVLPEGHLPPDLVDRLTKEATRTADRYLGMVIRSIEYLPVTDVTFGDVVRAIVTTDRDLHPADGAGLRRRLIEAFRKRGIYPDDAVSLGEESLALPRADHSLVFDEEIVLGFDRLLGDAASDLSSRAGGHRIVDQPSDVEDDESSGPVGGNWRGLLVRQLREWAEEHAEDLGFEQGNIAFGGRHVTFRRAEDHQPQPEISIRFEQRIADGEGGVLRSGTVVIAAPDGRVKYVIAKPLTEERKNSIRRHLDDLAADDLAMWSGGHEGPAFHRLHLSHHDYEEADQ